MPIVPQTQNFRLLSEGGLDLQGYGNQAAPVRTIGQGRTGAGGEPIKIAAAGGETTASPGAITGAQVGGGLGGGIGGLVGNIALLAGAAGRGGKRYLKDALEVYQKIQDPDFDMRDLTPAQYRIAAEMFPETFEAQLPGEAQTIADSPLARAQQAESVLGLQEISRTGLPEADRLAAEEAARAVRGAVRGGEESAIRSLRRRGRLGAGQELQARTAGGRGATDLAARLGSDLQRQALERRLQALGLYGSAAGALRGQDIGVEQSRADAINRFKEFAAVQRQQAAQYGAGARERAQQYNVGTAQEIANAQAQADYQTAQTNIERQNQLRQNLFTSQLARAGGEAGAYRDLYGHAERKRTEKGGQIQALSGGLGQALGGGIGLGALGG